jgi:DNA-binding NtrC family response regulator
MLQNKSATMTILKARLAEQATTNGHVLVIDDDITVADTVAMVLKTDGFDATVAYSGETGVELARNREFKYLVTCVVMPQMNGIEAAVEICKLLPECKVLLVSGHDDACALLQEALSRGYEFEILAKPVHPLVLFQTLRTLGAAQSSQAPLMTVRPRERFAIECVPYVGR